MERQMFERQIRTQIVAIPTANTTTADYNYGPFRQPNNLAPEIPGIVLSSPLWDYNPRKKQYRLCWYGYTSYQPDPDWDHPSICDNRLQVSESQRIGLVWIPQNQWEGQVDSLGTLDEYDLTGELYYKYITAARLDDGTTMMDFKQAGASEEPIGFEFQETSTSAVPGTKTMSVSRFRSWLYWGRRTTDRERASFYVCDHPDYGRSVFLANPYVQTTEKKAWTTIPCQVCTLQARYWFEDKRQRDIRPLAERISNLNSRDYEDPLNIQSNVYTVTHRNIPRRVTFIDVFGDVEPPWTPEELAERTASEARGVEYIRPYILMRMGGGVDISMQSGETADTLANLDARLPLGQLGQQQQDNAMFERILGTIDELGDVDTEHMIRVPIEDSDNNRNADQERNAGIDPHRNALEFALDSVLRAGNRIVGMALARGDPSRGLEEASLERQRRNRAQEAAAINEQAGLDETLENINPDLSPSGSAVSGESATASMESDTNANIRMEAPGSGRHRCGRFIGRVCNSISAGMSTLLGWSQGPGTGNSQPEQQNFREPIELDIGGAG
ncbi:hypothetical protein TWF718_009819 [Orbilia javanica]|uniref:Uncharacterized protein n=1 Tax=Orbilia javanica TaxID=47235 RepID=A0AAN8MX64_9PEZI